MNKELHHSFVASLLDISLLCALLRALLRDCCITPLLHYFNASLLHCFTLHCLVHLTSLTSLPRDAQLLHMNG